ncbi:arylsulfatase-like [Asterias rubens]|uniref:arylsulfatase-like n=1 Tax=Asterias rubens TaxID=7604 RepID=UPI0014553AFA|nr:arylsulfatase-like [Asterias rubens]XP_033645342.1 arylsulfatase-like [Asterias rubens]
MAGKLVCFLVLWFKLTVGLRQALDKPNIIIFLADDMGYGDLSSYGHPSQEFGPVDQMGREGMRFTQWYSAALFCTPSRGAMLTGRYPVRIGLYSTSKQIYLPVFVPASRFGLPKEEVTMAEALRDLGYATGMNGKWHLGINEFNYKDGNHLPMHHGFDFVGTTLPFSLVWRCDNTKKLLPIPDRPFCFLYSNDTIRQQPFNPHNLTSTLLLEAKSFVYNHQDEPFFFYFSFPQTHSNLFSSEDFKNSSRRGPYGDNVNEMSWAVGEMLKLLRELNLERNTLAIFLSDHGPEREMCKEGGSADPLKGWKGTSWDGGVRVPAIAWWPGTLPADVTNHEVISSMDLFNTAIDLAGGTPPTDRVIDGRSLKEVLLQGGKTPRETLFHYCGKHMMAVRYRQYKVHYHTQNLLTANELSEFCGPTSIPDKKGRNFCMDCGGTCVTTHDPPLIFNMDQDPKEEYPLDPQEYKDLLEDVERLLSEHKATMVMGKPLLNDLDKSLSPCCNPPYCWCNYSPVHTTGKI